MTNKQKSNQAGALSVETTDTQQGMQSSSAESQSISVTLASTALQSQSSPATPNSLVEARLMHAKIISAFAAKLGNLVEWRKLTLEDGRDAYALVFPVSKWEVDPVSKELTPLA